MKTIFLFPSRFKIPAQIIFGLVFLPICYCEIVDQDWRLSFLKGNPFWISDPNTIGNFTDEIACTLMIASLWVMAFSKLPVEDEQTSSLRLNSLYWAVFAYHILLIGETWLLYDFAFLGVSFYNILFILLLYNIRFEYLVYKQKASLSHEE